MLERLLLVHLQVQFPACLLAWHLVGSIWICCSMFRPLSLYGSKANIFRLRLNFHYKSAFVDETALFLKLLWQMKTKIHSSRCSASCPEEETVRDISISIHAVTHQKIALVQICLFIMAAILDGLFIMCSIHALIVTGLLHATKIGESDLSPDEVLDDT